MESCPVDLEIQYTGSGHIRVFATRKGIRALALGLHDALWGTSRAYDVGIQNLHIIFMLKRAATKGAG